MVLVESEETKEKFLIFVKDGEIVHICKFDAKVEVEKIKKEAETHAKVDPDQLVNDLVMANMIEIVIEPTARFIVIKQ